MYVTFYINFIKKIGTSLKEIGKFMFRGTRNNIILIMVYIFFRTLDKKLEVLAHSKGTLEP